MEEDLKKQLNELQVKLEQVSKDIIKLTVINEHQYEERQANSIKLEKMANEFTSVKGGLSLLKWLATMFGASMIAFCTWIVTTINEQQKEIYLLQQKTNINETRINEIKEDVDAISKP